MVMMSSIIKEWGCLLHPTPVGQVRRLGLRPVTLSDFTRECLLMQFFCGKKHGSRFRNGASKASPLRAIALAFLLLLLQLSHSKVKGETSNAIMTSV